MRPHSFVLLVSVTLGALPAAAQNTRETQNRSPAVTQKEADDPKHKEDPKDSLARGSSYLDGNSGHLQDLSRARTEFEGACAAGLAAGCEHAGGMYWNGYGVAQDRKRALALYQKACDGGDQQTCAALPAARSAPASPLEGTINSCAPKVADGNVASRIQEEELAQDAKALESAVKSGTPLKLSTRREMRTAITNGTDNAFPLAAKLAEKGDAEGQFYLGLFYLQGQGTLQSLDRGLLCLTHAASVGWAKASAIVGEIFYQNSQAQIAYFWLATSVAQLEWYDEAKSKHLFISDGSKVLPQEAEPIRTLRDKLRKDLPPDFTAHLDQEVAARRPGTDDLGAHWVLPTP
jgi:TPR repeat protein